MHLATPLVGLPEFLNRYDGALQWLHRNGVRIAGTRLDKYRKIMVHAENEERQSRFGHQQESALLNALEEAAEIIDISRIDEVHLEVPGVPEKLKTISGGLEEMAPDGFDPARDHAFEFHAASVLQSQMGFGGFSLQGGDLTVGELRYPAECKRVSSFDSLRNRLRAGRKKLERLLREGSPPGILAIDLTRPIKLAHGAIIAPSEEQFVREAERRLLAYLKAYVMTEKNIIYLTCRPVLGVVARYMSAGIAGNQENIRRAVVWNACSIHADGSPEDELFRCIARNFGTGDLREGTRQEITDAMEQVRISPRRDRGSKITPSPD